jgi:hypothetical protein
MPRPNKLRCTCLSCVRKKRTYKQDYRTVKGHLARDKQDAADLAQASDLPLLPANDVPDNVVYNNPVHDDTNSDFDSDTVMDDYVGNNPIKSLTGWDVPVTDAEGFPARTLADIAYQSLDHQTRHRTNNVCAAGVWDFGKAMLPEDNTMGTFGKLEGMMEKHRFDTVQVIHACRNMCVAFWDPTHHTLRNRLDLRNAHRTVCPVCGEDRYEIGTKKPVRIFWYLPIKYWLQDLFCKGDLVPHMANNLDPTKFPDGHVRR